jgi:glutamate carboxypeptidase
MRFGSPRTTPPNTVPRHVAWRRGSRVEERASRTAGPRPLLLAAALLAAAPPAAMPAQQPQLTDAERAIVAHVDANAAAAVELLERTVNINSGTLNLDGVRRVADVLEPEFRALGFETRWVPLAEVGRAGHLIAERRGTQGRRLLLIGHLDTVFEEDGPFQRFERIDATTVRGPGVTDMKSGNIVILEALRALHAVGALENTSIAVVLTGDEERPGRPLEISRRDLIEIAQRSDIALGFEAGAAGTDGDLAVIGRRSSSSWELRVHAAPAHSSRVFSEHVGAGAIFEASRILHTLYAELRGEPNLTFNPGLILGGTEAGITAEARGTASGRTNIVAEHVIVQGDIRTISDEQLERTRERMRHVVARSLPGARAEISFADGYPSMPPTDGNRELLTLYDGISRALGFAPVTAYDPGMRGAADISFVAPYVDGLDGLGPHGDGSHTVHETLDLRTMPIAAKRAAVMIHRLTRPLQ